MINLEFKSGSIFSSKAKMIVNPVNTVGVMGAGLALEFKRKFPLNYKAYQKHCTKFRTVKTFKLFIFDENQRRIVNLPTKEDYRQPSKLAYLRRGLNHLLNYLNDHPSRDEVESIAIPPIGAGLGGLEQVQSLFQIYFQLQYCLLQNFQD